MAAKYLKSLVTGVVLPYNEPALKSADIRLMEPAECEEYEASLVAQEEGNTPVTAKPEFEEVVVETSFSPPPDESERQKEASEDEKVMAALEVD
jgi:hypothetical protein